MSSQPFGPKRRKRRRHHGRHGADINRPASGAMNLSDMRVGEQGDIISLLGRRGLRRRLMEMGLIEGSKLRVVKFAPTGDPVEIQVNDYFLSLRKEDADHIIVDVEGPQAVD